MNFTDFYAKWGTGGTAASLNERQGAQPHFMDLCALLGVPTPGTDENYIFEQRTGATGDVKGYADVSKPGYFAWENKAPRADLDKALKQLLNYSHALSNPPLLVVCDRLTTRIHTQFTGHPSEIHIIRIEELEDMKTQALLRRVWQDPESFKPTKTVRDITEKAADKFAQIAERLRNRGLVVDKKGVVLSGTAVNSPEVVAHFLTQCLFCFFFDDVKLLPDRMFEELVKKRNLTADALAIGLANLFTTMWKGGNYGNDVISRFNGGLFETVKIPKLDLNDVLALREAAVLNWKDIDVSIFGTLFERGLDPKKRSQLGAHYTDPITIKRIIDPVIRFPLLLKWELSRQEIRRLMAKSKVKKSAKYGSQGRHVRATKGDKPYQQAEKIFVDWLSYLKDYRILDPACGSGNFLYLGLKVLKDIEWQSHQDAVVEGLDRQVELVTGPQNLLGLELDAFAAELARVTIWIGELQWRERHGLEYKKEPVLDSLDNIACRDALLIAHPKTGIKTEADWPKASVVVGNPPFLGGSKKRRELGDAYFEALDKVFTGRVPGGADLVCYWFDKALKAIEINGLDAAGLVSTNSIRGGANRKVLDAICEKSAIFEAWSDESWVNDGAAVRVSLIAFGHAGGAILNGEDVPQIYADLSAPAVFGNSLNLSKAKQLSANAGGSVRGLAKVGNFDIEGQLAREWLKRPNPHNLPNSEVLTPWANGMDVTRRPSDTWLIDFASCSESEASLFEAPFSHVNANVKADRLNQRDEKRREYWWKLGRSGAELRNATKKIPRYIATPMVAKHRLFALLDSRVFADQQLIVIARSDDSTFGILHSRFHELWALGMCSWMGVGNDPRYTPTTCFETFPFPTGLTPQDTASQQTRRLASGAIVPDVPIKEAESIAEAAHKLTSLRDNWLNPPDWTQRLPEVVPLGMTTSPYPDRIVPKPGHEKELSDRTLTKLYNARPAWLSAAHAALDAAVATAYGWTDYTAEMADEVILQRLLALNVERSVERSGEK